MIRSWLYLKLGANQCASRATCVMQGVRLSAWLSCLPQVRQCDFRPPSPPPRENGFHRAWNSSPSSAAGRSIVVESEASPD